jgi:Polyphosphate kinase 2 (PPK2)
MIEATHTPEAPWHIVPADDKRRARLNLIRHLLGSIPYKKVHMDLPTVPESQPRPKGATEGLGAGEPIPGGMAESLLTPRQHFRGGNVPLMSPALNTSRASSVWRRSAKIAPSVSMRASILSRSRVNLLVAIIGNGSRWRVGTRARRWRIGLARGAFC